MCGIVGYIGKRLAIPILINGLYNLEYRGYDSAGVAVVSDSKLYFVKCTGKVESLARSAVSRLPLSAVGIAHTRWATHGEPSVCNAHPHLDCTRRIAVVHNGIIENHYSIRERLADAGHVFESETDSEVICHLVEENMKICQNFEMAVLAALSELDGTYGLAILHSDSPDRLVAARKGSPLLIGIGQGQFMVASDQAALVPYCSKMVQLNDGDVAFISGDGIGLRTLDNVEVTRDLEQLEIEPRELQMGKYEHFMQKEIYEQPEALKNVMRGRISEDDNITRLGGLIEFRPRILSARRIILTGCGTSWHAALYGKYLLEKHTGLPVEVEHASEFRYRDPVVGSQDVVIALTQSGETADTLAASRLAKHKGALCLSLCNVVGSTIARESDAGIYIHAGPEIGVASTKTFTCQLVALDLLLLWIVRNKDRESEMLAGFARELSRLPALVSEILQLDPFVREVAWTFHKSRNFLYLGRGYNFPAALEGALKLKEISYIHAEGYPAAEMKHGPIAMVDREMPVVFLAPRDNTYSKVVANMEEIKARGGRIIVVTDHDDPRVSHLAEYIIRVPTTTDVLTPVLSVIPLQLLAYHIALLRGCDVDKPRNLAKSVTVE